MAQLNGTNTDNNSNISDYGLSQYSGWSSEVHEFVTNVMDTSSQSQDITAVDWAVAVTYTVSDLSTTPVFLDLLKVVVQQNAGDEATLMIILGSLAAPETASYLEEMLNIPEISNSLNTDTEQLLRDLATTDSQSEQRALILIQLQIPVNRVEERSVTEELELSTQINAQQPQTRLDNPELAGSIDTKDVQSFINLIEDSVRNNDVTSLTTQLEAYGEDATYMLNAVLNNPQTSPVVVSTVSEMWANLNTNTIIYDDAGGDMFDAIHEIMSEHGTATDANEMIAFRALSCSKLIRS